jgi:hypothetical protein
MLLKREELHAKLNISIRKDPLCGGVFALTLLLPIVNIDKLQDIVIIE